MKDLKIWSMMRESLETNENIILAVVVDSQGSSPGRQGFKLVITNDSQLGTIGGGVMEANIIKLAREVMANKIQAPLFKELLHYRNASQDKQSGLICSGSQIVVLIPINRNQKDIIEKIISSYSSNKILSLVVDQDGIRLSNTVKPFEMIDETNFEYSERVGYPHTVYIFGGGHVGSAISKAFSLLDFKVILIENRDILPDLERSYHQLHQIPYEKANSIVQNGERSYVLVVTAQIASDQAVLYSLRHVNVKFIGLMGSRTKIKNIMRYLRDQGVPEDFIAKINAPIGIKIANETAEEIGISVAAQIIDVKYSK